jgi:hypothetical protein
MGDANADDVANAGIEMLAAAATSDIPIVAIDFLTVGSFERGSLTRRIGL